MSRSSYSFNRAGGRNAAMPFQKYRPFQPVDLPDRQWPSRTITKAPRWCSVDLRDGNQALIDPMRPEEKLRFWNLLLSLGLEEIEVGFPAASQTDFDFVRKIITENRIPEAVTIQVLCQAREELIVRSVDAIAGAKRAIFHLYNSTSTLQRRVVFGKSRQEIIDLALEGVELVKREVARIPETEVILEYSPESFTGTELDFAVEVCSAVAQAWGVGPDRHMIINLPATVEMATPNIYADQIEWFCRNLPERPYVAVSLHTHNDRGTGIAASELGLLAGADRVEGTLFGNGERTGNADLVTLAMNMFSQGVDPEIDLSDMRHVRSVVESCNKLPVHERHPYAGDLVFTAFSGSHQDAIRKGMDAIAAANSDVWEVPYLPIDPGDIGRTFEAIIRVNSQSGKAGSAYLLEADHHVRLPRGAEIEFSGIVQDEADRTGKEITSKRIWELAEAHFIRPTGTFELVSFDVSKATADGSSERVVATVLHQGQEVSVSATGNGPISAFVDAMRNEFGLDFRLADFGQNTRSATSRAEAAAYVELVKDVDGKAVSVYGVGIDTSITMAPIRAVVSALNKLQDT